MVKYILIGVNESVMSCEGAKIMIAFAVHFTVTRTCNIDQSINESYQNTIKLFETS